MSPAWITSSDLGVFSESSAINIEMLALSLNGSPTYSFVGGEVPSELTITGNKLTGVLSRYITAERFYFTLRVTDSVNGLYTDRTFTLKVIGETIPEFAATQADFPTSAIIDSSWFEWYPEVIIYDPELQSSVQLHGGNLPPGLRVENNAIVGYPLPPIDSLGNPTTISYTFELSVKNILGSSIQSFTIDVENADISGTPRVPSILNTRPLSGFLSDDTRFRWHYLNNANITVNHNERFALKMIGYNFNAAYNDSLDPYSYDIEYIIDSITSGPNISTDLFTHLPNIINWDSSVAANTGWISGTVNSVGENIITHYFTVTPRLISSGVTGETIPFTITVIGDVDSDIQWEETTPIPFTNPPIYQLGILDTGEISYLSIDAGNSTGSLVFSLAPGSDPLPVGLEILTDGSISGKVSFTTPIGDYDFDVMVGNPSLPAINSVRRFRITVIDTNAGKPFENIYFTPLSEVSDRQRIDKLLSHVRTTHSSVIYRNEDKYFGVSDGVEYVHSYGVPSISFRNPLNPTDTNHISEIYANAILKYHYDRHILLGAVKVAIAHDTKGKMLYDVVYCDIIDYMENNSGESISSVIPWPTPITRNSGDSSSLPPLLANIAEQTLYPFSLTNSRNHLISMLGTMNSSKTLPRWMISQQNDGSVLGYTRAWPICYTKPGHGETVRSTVLDYLNTNNATDKPLRVFNQISFRVDRFYVDRSATWEWGIDTPNTWPITDAVPTDDRKNATVRFPRKTILRKI
jgi:hypothetical protein